MARFTVVAAVLGSACLALASIPSNGIPDIVTFEGGQTLGVRIPTGNLRYWLGVPFAATTGGSNQWMPPQPREPWNFTLDCTNWGSGCYSTDHNPDTSKNMSYDCLNANIYAPITSPGTKLPVMLFLYGGAFKEGDNMGPFGIYSGAYIASTQNVIVVAINYRLGAMGFLVTDTLKGNFALMDQRAGMQWVQRNIGLVGGDPTQVTLWGESAGAMSIGFHLTSPKSAGLFSKAIMESNPSGFNYKNLSEANVYGQTFCQLLNCTNGPVCNTPCIQAASPQAITKAWGDAAGNVIDFILADWGHLIDGFLQFTPVVDGEEVVMEPLAAIQSGNWDSSIPLLLGTNTNEGETFIYAAFDFEVPGFLIALGLDVIFTPEDSARIAAVPRYNMSGMDSRNSLSNVLTDYWFRCASNQFAIAAASAGTKAWVYRFDHLFSGADIFPTFGLPAICAQVVCHAAELPFTFHNDVPSVNATFTPAELIFSTALVDYWTSFVKNGDPNKGSNQTFVMPQWNSVNRTNAVLNITMTTESATNVCSLWDSIGYFF